MGVRAGPRLHLRPRHCCLPYPQTQQPPRQEKNFSSILIALHPPTSSMNSSLLCPLHHDPRAVPIIVDSVSSMGTDGSTNPQLSWSSMTAHQHWERWLLHISPCQVPQSYLPARCHASYSISHLRGRRSHLWIHNNQCWPYVGLASLRIAISALFRLTRRPNRWFNAPSNLS
jgi:hypothetical protein